MAQVALTAGRIANFRCPSGRAQAFLWDSTATGLGLRATASGARAFIWQGRLAGAPLRVTIGDPASWSILQARDRARELQRIVDSGRDPRTLKAEATARDQAARAAKATEQRRTEVLVRDAWFDYLADRRPHWGERHAADHDKLARPGGKVPLRGVKSAKADGKLTTAGPLHALMHKPLAALDAVSVEAWAKREAAKRPTQARLAARLLKAFIAWCATREVYKAIIADPDAAKGKRVRQVLGSPAKKDDVLLREQLPAWFAAVRAMPNPAHAAYVQSLLLIGCRPGELLALRWDDVDTQWRSLRIRDKVEGTRAVPLTPFVAHLLAGLPRRADNPWVFSSAAIKGGCMASPALPFARACTAAGLEGLTFHGLRRSFKSLTEWLDVPAGVVAQLQGHKPSATVERHYARRPLDLLRVHAERIEAWILGQAGVDMPAQSAPSLRVVRKGD